MYLQVSPTGQERVIHVFERAGHGKAPFKFIGMEEKVIVYPNGSTQAGSSCDYCSKGIRYCYWIKSSDGNTFKVGSECVRKTDDAGLIREITVAERKLKDEQNRKKRLAKIGKIAESVAQADAALPSIAGLLHSQPHPSIRGLSMLDYVKWLKSNTNGERYASIVLSTAKK